VTDDSLPRRVFLTGGTGYLGSRLIPLLIERGHHVTSLVRTESASRVPRGCQPIVGNALNNRTFADQVHGSDTFVQLVGVPHPAPWKGSEFRVVDLVSGLASIAAAKQADVSHFVYVSVAHPAPVMKDYIAVRTEVEDRLRASGLRTTIVRPWYILGPGHWWPLVLKPGYWFCERLPSTRDAATRLGLVTVRQMLSALVWAVEHPAESVRVMEVPDIRMCGRDRR
jgi:uncharacterized protein YbjT (DUF2867 family)